MHHLECNILNKTTCQDRWFLILSQSKTRLFIPNRNHPNGGVRGGTIRLLPVDSKAEAKRSRLLSS